MSERASSLRMKPKPCWVDMAGLAGKASFSGTGTGGAA